MVWMMARKKSASRSAASSSKLLAAVLFVFSGALARAADLTGSWFFTHADNRFEGTITLRHSGSELSGTWHTAKGKSEPDTAVAGTIDGHTVTLTRFIGSERQVYTLTLSSDGDRLDGFGEGWFLNHTNLNLRRAAPPPAAPPKKSGLLFPRSTWNWAMQSVAGRKDNQIQYSAFYYEASTGRSVERPLSLPAGASIVGAFPDDCAFLARNSLGVSMEFKSQEEARGRRLGPGDWSVYPQTCGGIVVFLK